MLLNACFCPLQPSDWEIKVEDMHLRMAAAVMLHSIPKELVYSMDETFVFFVPMKGTRTYAEKGSKSVSVVGAEEKRGCTASITCKPTGAMVPFMVSRRLRGSGDLLWSCARLHLRCAPHYLACCFTWQKECVAWASCNSHGTFQFTGRLNILEQVCETSLLGELV